jgi:hypothetical protein
LRARGSSATSLPAAPRRLDGERPAIRKRTDPLSRSQWIS